MKRVLLLLLLCTPAFAQEYANGFQSPASAAGWLGSFQSWPDPLDPKNLVFGTKEPARDGSFATLKSVQFGGRFEYRGRLLRTHDEARLGIAFFSSVPDREAYYLIALSGGGGGKRRSVRTSATGADFTMQLTARGGGAPAGTLESDVRIDANRWYEFLVEADELDHATHIRARFWPAGTPEPETFQIEARDPSVWRLTSGRIALWSAARGETYFDDLAAKSFPSELTTIQFFDAETQQELDASKLALFKKPARIDVRVTGDASPLIRLDGVPYSGAPIAADGMHELTVQAGFVTATLRLLVDRLPPALDLLGNGAPLGDGKVFGRDVTVDAKVTDVSRVTLTSSLGALPLPLAQEASHSITVTAVDQVGWSSSATATFVIDKTAPAVTLLGNGVPFLPGHTFNHDVTLTWTAADATLDSVTATLNGNPMQSGAVVSAEAAHAVVVIATDRAGHTTRVAREFVLRRNAPEVRLLANGAPLAEKTYGAAITITADFLGPTPVTYSATLDGQPYTLGTAIAAEGMHTFTITARNAAGLETTIGPLSFGVDVTRPVLTLFESGAPFSDGMKFNRDVLPQVTATDNLATSPVLTLLVNGRAHAVGAKIAEERAEHVITATAVDDAGNVATVGPFRFVLDKTRPVVTIVEPKGDLFAKPVQVKVTVDDLTATTLSATLGGNPIDLEKPVEANGTHQLSVVATDAVGWDSEPARATFTIDTLAPSIRFTSPSEVTTPLADVAGFADDAVSVVINGRAAQVDVVSKTFALQDVALAEGVNELVAVATDRAGNASRTPHAITRDTRAPELTITAPAANACLDTSSVEVRGVAVDRSIAAVKVNGTDATVANGTFSATVPFANEGAFLITVEAMDGVGHTATAAVPVTIDRTAPVIDVTEGSTAFSATLLNRAVALFPKITDGDVAPRVTATLDGKPYAAGTPIAEERTHELTIAATDCAGHTQTKTIAFEIDRTAPSILTFVPQNEAKLGSKPQITGTTTPDAVSITVEPGGRSYAVTSGAFTLADVPLGHGLNAFTLTVTDRAGNAGEQTYTLTLDLSTPSVEIVERGVPIPPNALFARDVRPVIRASESGATISATLNGGAFTSGTTITAAGAYTLTATATDSYGHTSAPATASFTIDRDAPRIDITSPASGAYTADELIEVRGTIAGADVREVVVNATRATVTTSAFTATVPVEFGPNLIVATAIDRAGNAASDQVEITRGTGPLAIVLTAPFDGLVTNRRTTVVSGQLLTAAADAKVTLNGVELAVDPGGFFRKTGFALTEGENVITAAVVNGAGERNQTSVRVTADLTPPRVRLLESGQPLADGARFAERAVITVESSDGVPQLVVDSDVAPASTVIDEDGGHTLVATARDAAGNETRVERTIFIGGAGSGACRLSDFDPAHGSVVTSPTVTISGRTGGATAVTVNGTPAVVANGSFCATVELPAEGDNALVISCEGAGEPQTLVLRRATNEPSIAIELPAEGSVTVNETIAVSGTAGGAITVDVNGVPATLNGGAWSVPNVRLANGLNVLVARARGASGRTVATSRRVLYLKDAPAVTITAPAASLVTGSNSIDVSGGWSNVDPATITVGGVAANAKTLSDTTGTFAAAAVALVPGSNTITVAARDAAGRTATASVVVTLTAGAPSVTITEPADNAVFSADSADTFTVRGTFHAAAGSTVEVAGETATLDGTSFTATVRHATGRVTPVLARVTTPDGAAAVDVVRVTKLAARPKVLEHFPAAALDVDAGAMPLVLFSLPMDLASTKEAFRLETASGSPVSGTFRLDRDVATFAPAALLAPGERYTIRVAGTAKSIGGDALEAALATTFTVASTAGSRAPTLNPIAAGCAQQVSIGGTAPANARLRIDLGPLTFTTTATASGSWSFQLPAGGYSGYQVVRVRVAGSDGSLSPAAESCFLVDCAGPQVVSASFDRTANRLTITFTKEVKPPAGDAIVLRLADNRTAGATLATNAKTVTVTPSEDLTRKTFTLTVTTAVEDLGGTRLSFPFTQTFTYDADAPPTAGDGSGFMSGEVFDAETGRPLAGAAVFVDVAAMPLITDARGRYAAQLPEGAHTLRVTADGYTSVWRQIIIPPGAGVIPIDVRLTPALRPIDAQSLPGLLPLGWSPLAAKLATAAGTLEFTVPAAEIIAAAQTLTVVRYHDDRDEWRVLTAAANIIDGKVTVPADAPGAYALVYPDQAPQLARPPTPTSGAVLTGVADPCAAQPCALEAESFTLVPPVILPTGKTVATLKIKGATANFPSGTAVQAYIDEELRLADGSRVTDPPFTTDLLLYRNLAGTTGVAEFRLGPSPRAAEVILDVGFNHIRILPYPGRLDRGTLVGPEGGRVPGDGRVTVEIPAGATTEAMRATTATIEDLSPFGTIDGFTIAGGFTLTLQLARTVAQPDGLNAGRPELLQSARATFPNIGPGQYILVEVLDGPRFRLAAQMEPLSGGRVTTKAIDRALLPLDGVVREGRYLLLKANAPIAFATGLLRDPNGLYLRDARITAPLLGVTDVTRVTGTYAIPVQAAPAAPFVLIAGTNATGDGAPYTHAAAPAQDAVVRVDFALQAVAPKLLATEPSANATEVALTAFVKAHFDADLDATSVTGSMIVVDDATQTAVDADVLLESPRTILWRLRGGENRLAPNRTYTVTIAPTIRGANRTPFGRTHVFHFSTLTQLSSNEIHPEKIRITVPDANGHSRVTGTAGALPAGFIALVTRRHRDFITAFQAQAAADGSFTIDITEPVALSDVIDLQVLNAARAIAAIVPLTPFVTGDGRGFVAPADRTVTFHGDLATITVAAGTFDTPTLVTTAAAATSAFARVPGFEAELPFHTGITIDFDGVATKPLEVDLPVPANTITDGKTFFLARLGQSSRGPRMEIDDTIAIAAGRFTTRETGGGANLRVAGQSVFTGTRVKDNLLRITQPGDYAVVEIVTAGGGLAFVAAAGIAAGLELFVSQWNSLYCSMEYLTASRGRAVFPVLADQAFTVDGVDSTSGLAAFRTSYTGVPLPPAGTIWPIRSPAPNATGPYPVFGRPLFVHIADLHAEDVKQVPVGGIEITLPAGTGEAVVTRTRALPREYGVLNVRGGYRAPSAEATRNVIADLGDRLVVFGTAENVVAARDIELVFNEAINTASLEEHIVLEKKEGAAWLPVPVTYRVDSNGRRVWLDLGSEMQRGAEYRTILRHSLRDVAEEPRELGVDLVLPFTVRKPHGDLLGGPFSLPDGSVRDLALDGNLLFVSATEGDLLAYDVSDPAALATKPPIARASAKSAAESAEPVDIPGDTWAVTVDHHGRIWTTAQTDRFGVIRSFRVEDFAHEPTPPPAGGAARIRPVKQVAASIVSWRPGANANLPLGTTWLIQSDRAEAIPRRLQVALQDESFDVTATAAMLFAGNALDAVANATGTLGEFTTWRVVIPRSPVAGDHAPRFRRQRVTVHNQTAHLRWSADIAEGASSATLEGVLARPGDRLKVMRNVGTYAVVALLGYGVGFYDLNALEHNRRLPVLEASRQFAEQLALTEGRQYDPVVPSREVPPCDESAQQGGSPCGPRALTYVSDAVAVPALYEEKPSRFDLFALETRKGLVDVSVNRRRGLEATGGNKQDAWREAHLAFTGSFNNGAGVVHNDHPRLVKIRKAFAQAGRTLNARFSGMARFDDASGNPFALIAAQHFGILVVDLKRSLTHESLASIIWLPAGAYGVRHIAGTHYATAVDGEGRSLLIDLSNIDERDDVAQIDIGNCPMPCDTLMFPIVRKALAAGPDPGSALRFGSDDPRILWKSAPDFDNVYGTLAPVADPDTGMIYSGDLLQETVRVLAGLEPRIRIAAKVVADAPMQAVDAVVPLGIQPPSLGSRRAERGGMGAFRIEVSLPGSMGESHDGTLQLRVEAERVPGVPVEWWPTGWPAAHADVLLRRAVPDRTYRFQKGWNLFVSEPLIVVADPRATKAYRPAWGSATYVQKEIAGCFNCEPPSWASAQPEAKELYSYGRRFVIRPRPGAFGGPYAWIGDKLETTLGTIVADTVRPKSVQVAGQNPPVAGGLLQETTYLHSGELETSAIDLVATGRAGWDVAVGRTYRSRTLGWTPLGFGWDSPLFKRLRPLPNGNVEYRDGAEVWVFTRDKNHYVSPRGLFVKLTRDESGWTLVDQSWRVTRFNDRGQVISESDEFVDPLQPGSGNTIRYAYDEREQLAAIVDPTGRKTSFTYDSNTGFLKEITDWRGRTVKYDVVSATLREVTLPAAKAGEGVPAEFDHSTPPRIRYAYAPAGASFADQTELQNLLSITDPDAVALGGHPRVRFTYGDPSALLHGRDRVVGQTWPTLESATFAYSPDNVVTKDVLGQVRTYTLAEGGDERAHVASVTEHAVPLAPLGEGAVPGRTPVARDLTTTFEKFGFNGELLKVTYPNGRKVDLSWEPANGPGVILKFIRDYGPDLVDVLTHLDYDTAQLATNIVLGVARYEEGAPPVRRETPSPSRNRRQVVKEDEGIKETTTYDEFGQLTSIAVTDEGGGNALTTRVSYYTGPHSNLLQRGRPFRTSTGDISQSFTYSAAPGGGEVIETRDGSRGTITKTVLDAHDRTIRQTVTAGASEILSDERFGYDAAGRLAYHARTQKPLGLVETRIRFDAVGRPVETSMTHANVNGAPATIVAQTQYDVANRKITRFDPAVSGDVAAAFEETILDGLGRPTSITRRGSDPNAVLQQVLGYDIHGQVAYETDNVRTAVVRIRDILGRERTLLTSDGRKIETGWTAWNEPVDQIVYDATGERIGRSKKLLTAKGRVRGINEELNDEGATRQTRFDWKGGRVTSTRIGRAATISDHFPAGPYRTEQIERDLAGRVHVVKTGETDATNALLTDPAKIWNQTETTYIGAVPSTVITSEPRAGAAYTTRFAYDGLDRPTHVIDAGGAYTTRSVYDEAGNVVELRRPGMNAETATFDARGLPLETVLADGAAVKFVYDARGIVRQRIDEAGESTFSDTDDLGRVVKVRYADGSFEQTVYEPGSGQVKATRDRGGQWLSYTYDGGGRVTSTRNGEDPAAAPPLVLYEYDAAGRLSLVRNKDAGIGFEQYDFLGRPRVTRAYRYADGTGLGSATVRDKHTQTHTWSMHDGEREEWRMPVAGDVGPESSAPWLQRIAETRDAGGNLISQKTAAGRVLLDAVGRSTGRLSSRTRFTPDGRELATAYGYADGSELRAPVELPRAAEVPQSGAPLWSHSTFGSFTLAGSAALRDDAMRLAAQRDLATSRVSGWRYDDRGRMTASLLSRTSLAAEPTVDTLVHADFRAKRTVPPLFTPAEHELLGAEAAKIEPLSWTQAKSDALHQPTTRTLLLDGEPEGQPIAYRFNAAGRRIEGGGWTSTYDELGRLTAVSSADRRIEYLWDPNNRLIGRIAKQPAGEGSWRTEDRGQVLARDGLPADTTFVWDPIVDRLVAIFAAGADPASGPDAGLLRQYLHGGNAYDDPTRVITASTTYFPIFDETAAGSLTAVAGADGNLVERVLYADAYGDAPRYLHGPVVDQISTQIRKSETGDLAQVKIRVHLSDAIVPASILFGLRLTATRPDGTVAHTSTVTPTLEDRFTAVWTLTAAEWTTLTTAPAADAIEVAVTHDLRAEGWGPAPAMPLPTWARTLYPHTSSSATHPVIVREPLSALRTFTESIAPGQANTRIGWRVADLYVVAAVESKSKVLVGFKAYPFRDPATGLVYARARWYDAQTGTFLTPDPAGYADSGNLYAGFGNDPVNNFDSAGEAVDTVWDAVSLVIGGVSLYHNLRDGNYGLAALDALGIVVDTAAVLAPFVPGGVGAALKVSRAAGALAKAQLVDQTINFAQGSLQAVSEYSQGNGGWATVYAGMIGFGLRGMNASQFRFTSEGIGVNLGNVRMVRRAPAPTRAKRGSRETPGPPAKLDARGRWHDARGRFTRFAWPPNRGFISGYPRRATLLPGAVVDRYGRETGTFVSPFGVPFPERALPPSAATAPYGRYEVVKPFEVDAGPAEPWFGQPGLGLQYELPDTVENLINDGFLRRLP